MIKCKLEIILIAYSSTPRFTDSYLIKCFLLLHWWVSMYLHKSCKSIKLFYKIAGRLIFKVAVVNIFVSDSGFSVWNWILCDNYINLNFILLSACSRFAHCSWKAQRIQLPVAVPLKCQWRARLIHGVQYNASL